MNQDARAQVRLQLVTISPNKIRLWFQMPNDYSLLAMIVRRYLNDLVVGKSETIGQTWFESESSELRYHCVLQG